MGQILIIEGADFSGNPNAINAIDVPVVTDKLQAFYNNRGVEVDGSDSILRMPSNFVQAPDFTRIPGETTSPAYHAGGTTYFKGGTTVYGSVPGLVAQGTSYDLDAGVSFTLMTRLSVSTDTSSNRCMLGIEQEYIQFYSATSLSGHLRIGAPGSDTVYDIGMGGVDAGVHAFTFVLGRDSVALYIDGVSIGTTSIAQLPETLTGMTSIGSNWLGTSRPVSDQLKQLYIHAKALSISEVQAIHSAIFALTP